MSRNRSLAGVRSLDTLSFVWRSEGGEKRVLDGDVTNTDSCPVISPDAAMLAWSSSQEVAVKDLVERVVLYTAPSASKLVWSADSVRLAGYGREGQDGWWLDTGTGELSELSKRTPSQMYWSPDGGRIAVLEECGPPMLSSEHKSVSIFAKNDPSRPIIEVACDAFLWGDWTRDSTGFALGKRSDPASFRIFTLDRIVSPEYEGRPLAFRPLPVD